MVQSPIDQLLKPVSKFIHQEFTGGIAALNSTQILIYHNPAKDQVIITGLPANTAIRLTDITGKTLQEMVTINGNNKISLAGLSPGTYLLCSSYGNKGL